MSFRILGLKAPDVDTRNEVEQMLDREIHDSEGLRAIVLAFVFATCLGGYGYACFTEPELVALVLPRAGQRALVGGSLGIALLVATLTKPASVLLKRANRPPPLGGRLISAFLETSLPTALMFALTARRDSAAVNALLLPAFFYFPLIILSILRLERRISVFTGLVAGIEYAAISFWILRHAPPVDSSLASPGGHLVRAAILVLSGILAGEASSRIRDWIGRSYAMIEARQQAENERKRTLDRFGQHVSPAVAAKLLETEAASELRQVCVMFLDIRNFTSFSEKRGPEEVVQYLNSLFGFMIEAVNARNGIINKFLGDGFMAVFGAPLSDGKECRNALDAARDIIAGVDALISKGAIAPTRIGIGLHSGPAVTGVVGTATRGEYTVIGDVVNLASRIESLNKDFESRLLVSVDVLAAAGEKPASAVSRGPVKVKGRETTVEIFQLA